MIVNGFERYIAEINRQEVAGTIQHYQRRLFYSYFGMYFKLKLIDRIALFSDWFNLLERMQKLMDLPVNIKSKFRLAGVLRSGLFVKWIVFNSDGCIHFYGRIHKVLKRLCH